MLRHPKIVGEPKISQIRHVCAKLESLKLTSIAADTVSVIFYLSVISAKTDLSCPVP